MLRGDVNIASHTPKKPPIRSDGPNGVEKVTVEPLYPKSTVEKVNGINLNTTTPSKFINSRCSSIRTVPLKKNIDKENQAHPNNKRSFDYNSDQMQKNRIQLSPRQTSLLR